MPIRPLPIDRRALLTCLFAAMTALTSAALLAVAAELSAPPVSLAFIVVVCVVFPMAAAYELPPAIAALRAGGLVLVPRRELTRLRRELERLPETAHPLGL